MELTPADRLILQSYHTVVEGLASYLGEGCEVVLHSLENLDHSVVKIVNGHHTGRREGSPITDLALTTLGSLESEDGSHKSYFSKNRRGEPLKACTILIRGEENRVIALLCINYYINTPLAQFLEGWLPPADNRSLAVNENFAENTGELVQEALERAKMQAATEGMTGQHHNRSIIELLAEWGIFKLKDSVVIVADGLGISKNTVYLHLRNIRGKDEA